MLMQYFYDNNGGKKITMLHPKWDQLKSASQSREQWKKK